MEKCGRQKAGKKVSLKVFLRSETQTKILGCQMENSGSQFFFKNQNEENAFAFGAPVAIYKQKKKKSINQSINQSTTLFKSQSE